jgi:hypothetical protein
MKIKVPPSVNQVYSVYQTLSLPSGHRFVAEDPAVTHIHEPTKVGLPHTRIDESPLWWELVKLRLINFVNA